MTGTQSATLVAALTATDPGEPAWVEDPGYEGTRLAMQLAGLRTVSIEVDEEGLDLTRGLQIEPDARLAVVSPSHQYPTGVVMSLTRRLKFIDWASRSGAYLIEDDYDSEFRYDGEPIASLKSLDRDRGRVLYVGTLSKILAPGLRLGFLIVPDHLIDAARAVRCALDRQVSLPLQAVASEFIGNGHLGQHIRKLRSLYGERRAALLEALDRSGSGLFRVFGAATGVHVLGELPSEVDDRAVARAARAKEVGVEPLSAYRLCSNFVPRPALLIGFANTPPPQIQEAVSVVARVVEAELREARSTRALAFSK
jgi:GntR family transcriptional regulator/MocR family aminotransferase